MTDKDDLTTSEIADILDEIHSKDSRHYSDKIEISGIAWKMLPGVLRPDISETTTLLENFIPDLTGKVAADIGCGSGYLTSRLAHKNAKVVYATDIEQNAIDCTSLNNANLIESKRLKVFLGDLFEPIPKNVKLDFILINPPYFEGGSENPRSIDSALFGGISFMRRFFSQMHGRISSDTEVLIVYSSKGMWQELEKLFANANFTYKKNVFGIEPGVKHPRKEEYYVYILRLKE